MKTGWLSTMVACMGLVSGIVSCSTADAVRDVAVFHGGHLYFTRWLDAERAKAEPLAALGAARARWEASGVRDYRVTVTYTGFEICRQDYQVRMGRFEEMANPCPTRPLAHVADLFVLVEDRIRRYHGACGPNGCACDVLQVNVTYNANLGYPEQMTVVQTPPAERQRLSTDGGTPPTGLLAWAGGAVRACRLMGFAAVGLEGVALSPLP